MVSTLCQSTLDPDNCGTSLTVTGAGGFGKTSIVTGLCHHPVIKEQFKDGVAFIELGPQTAYPSIKLSLLYHLLTGQYLKQDDINHAKQEIKLFTSHYCPNLLVIIDDVWHVEDAEPIVKAFSNCKIVLTTRMNDIEQCIPTKQVVNVGPMEQSEAISLLTSGVIDISQLSQEDVSLLDELAQDVHLWPLLLSLIRRQFSNSLRINCLSCHKAIQNMQDKLNKNGLTAFDGKGIARSRKDAVKVCIEMSLQLLTKSLSDKVKLLTLCTGIGGSLQVAVLHYLWNIAEKEARDVVRVLWAYGLVKLTDIVIPPHNATLQSVEVHAVISHFIAENMDSNEVVILLNHLNTGQSIFDGLKDSFMQSYGVSNLSSLASIDYLKYKKNEIKYLWLPFYIQRVNMYATIDPHLIIVALQQLCDILISSSTITELFPSLKDDIILLVTDHPNVLNNGFRYYRMFSQSAQQCLAFGNYQDLIQTIDTYYANSYPLVIVQKAVTMVQKFIPYCDGKLRHDVLSLCEKLLLKTRDYHDIALYILPCIKLSIKEIHQIDASL